MALKDIKGQQVLDVLADLIDPFISIALDENASAMFKREKCPEGMEPTQFFLDKVRKSLPALIKEHRDEFILILAVMDGYTPSQVDEYAEGLTFAKLLKGVYDMLTDEELLAFLS